MLPYTLKALILSASGTFPVINTVSTSLLSQICSIALYGLLVFYGLTKEELADRRPLAKFLSIKLIVMFTFYQTFVVSPFYPRVHYGLLHADRSRHYTTRFMVNLQSQPDYIPCSRSTLSTSATPYWTTTNISNGLNALCICIEVNLYNIYSTEATNSPIFLDDIFFGIDVVGVHCSRVQKTTRNFTNQHLAATVGFVRIFPFTLCSRYLFLGNHVMQDQFL